MDKFSADLLDRIRSAVIKKLREMERYVDNELPDYIMILVANKRTASHMQKDLTLFLGKHTPGFVKWLSGMIGQLKKNSSSVVPSVKPEPPKENSEKTKSEEDGDVLDYDLGDQEEELLDQDDSNSSIKPSASGDSSTSKVVESTEPVRGENAISISSRQLTTQKSAKVHSVQPFCRLSSQPNISLEEQRPTFHPSSIVEYDPTKPEFTSGMSSVVRNMRKGSYKPPARQTNKLLLRAVDDATKSVMHTNMNRYKPTPIKVLASTKQEKFGSRSHNLVSVKIDPSLNLDKNPVLSYSEPSTINVNEQEPTMSVFESDNYDLSIRSGNFGTDNNNRTIRLSSEQMKMDTDAVFSMNEHSSASFQMNEFSAVDPSFQMNEYSEVDASYQMNEYSEVDDSYQMKNEYSEDDASLQMKNEYSPDEAEQEEKQTNTHFIVTLNGVDLNAFNKRKYSESDESMDAEDGFLPDEEGEVNPKKPKLVERCKYWPSCTNSDCVYHHPSIPCTRFPECRYGDKCFYIHPDCKFDSQCSRKDCPYTHVTKKKFALPLLANKPAMKVQGFKPVCKFYPKCTVKNCAFIHPKLCRFGTKCRSQTCRFTHVSIPPRKQMKWKASASEDV